jgi:hypothetical protein
MKRLFKPTAIIISLFSSLAITAFFVPLPTKEKVKATPVAAAKIQAAILLDVSGSMNGLIEQAKAQLWTMVSTMGRVQCKGVAPQIEIALYEYGRPANGLANGYIKQISGFTSDLDMLSQKLFSLSIDGGDEYCGQVIYASLKELKWDTAATNYKVIFIAGNEDFLQGNTHYTKACTAAKNKGVIVNTIYCGDKMQGIREHWNLAGECGNGSFTNINQNTTIDDVPTPYDSLLISLNDQLNGTYIAYGSAGTASISQQKEVDKMNFAMNKSAGLKRAKVKSNAGLYKNSNWDLVDGYANDLESIDKLDRKSLPDSLQTKSNAAIKAIITKQSTQRGAVQQQMATLNAKRDAYIIAEKAKNVKGKNTETLETVIEKIIKEQAKRYNMTVL